MIPFKILLIDSQYGEQSFDTFEISEKSTIKEFLKTLLNVENSRGVPLKRVMKLQETDSAFAHLRVAIDPATIPVLADPLFNKRARPLETADFLHNYALDDSLESAMHKMGKDHQTGYVVRVLVFKAEPLSYIDQPLEA
jgi:hypothetical protein